MTLPEGYYQMTETAAPAGYIITHRQFEFRVVDQQGDKVVYTDTTDGDITFDQATMTFKVKNKAGQSLPNTGGPGTALYTLSGMMLLICSALLYGFRRRHEERRSA
jgi:LPXTG-motif cell wall-anchored protein